MVHSISPQPTWNFPTRHFATSVIIQVRDAAPMDRPETTQVKYNKPSKEEKIHYRRCTDISLLNQPGAPQIDPGTEHTLDDLSPLIEAYTDGSCPDNRAVSQYNPAGWGWCLTYATNKNTIPNPDGDDWTEGFGLVNTNPDNPSHIGAEVGSNNTAELQAAIELLDYLLMHSPTIPIRINLDSRVGTLDLPPFLVVVFLICCCL
jgi:hypothetical protein